MTQGWREIVKGGFVLVVLSLKNEDLSEMNKHSLEVSNIISFHRPLGSKKKKNPLSYFFGL